MNVCGLTRLLVPAFLVGLAVATVSGNDLGGWLAAGLTVVVLIVARRVGGTAPTCAMSPKASSGDARDSNQVGEKAPPAPTR